MKEIPIKMFARQSLSIMLENSLYEISLKECNGIMAATVIRDQVLIVSNRIMCAGMMVIPDGYLEEGNFVILTDNGELPYYSRFESTDTMVYLTIEEVEAIRSRRVVFTPSVDIPLPEFYSWDLRDRAVRVGGSISFNATNVRNQTSLDWLNNSTPVGNNPLTINPVVPENEGYFQARATNEAGSVLSPAVRLYLEPALPAPNALMEMSSFNNWNKINSAFGANQWSIDGGTNAKRLVMSGAGSLPRILRTTDAGITFQGMPTTAYGRLVFKFLFNNTQATRVPFIRARVVNTDVPGGSSLGMITINTATLAVTLTSGASGSVRKLTSIPGWNEVTLSCPAPSITKCYLDIYMMPDATNINYTLDSTLGIIIDQPTLSVLDNTPMS